MDFLTFDDLLKNALQVDASRRLELLTLIHYGAQSDSDGIKELRKSMLRQAEPDTEEKANPNGGMQGLKAALRTGKIGAPKKR
jgi:hypothetical protein